MTTFHPYEKNSNVVKSPSTLSVGPEGLVALQAVHSEAGQVTHWIGLVLVLAGRFLLLLSSQSLC